MENPWLGLPDKQPYVLSCDREAVELFNGRLDSSDLVRLHVDDVIPEPFVGAVRTAPVVILQLNPGCAETDNQAHADPAFRTALYANLRHEASDWPFYFLDPRFRDVTPGGRWWTKTLRMLIDELSFERVSNNVAVIEWFPYKSRKFRRGCRTSSQDYGFALVRLAIERKALIIVSRAVTLWEKAVPELCTYPHKLTLSSTQNVVITANNLKFESAKTPHAWQMLIDALGSAKAHSCT